MAQRRRQRTGEAPRTAGTGAAGLSVPRPALARALGLSERQVLRLEAAGLFPVVAPGAGRRPATYDLGASVRAYVEHRLHHSPRDQQALAQARLTTLRYQREKGALLPRAEYIRQGQLLASALVAKVRSLPTRLVRAGVLTSATEPRALAAVDEMLSEITRWRSEQDLQAAASNGRGA